MPSSDTLLDSDTDRKDEDIASDGEDITSDVEGSVDNDHSYATDNDGAFSDADCDGDGDITMGDSRVCDILLDSVADAEEEDVGPDDGDDAGPEDGDKQLAESNCGLSGTELGIVPPRSTRTADDRQLPPNVAGCLWVGEDWSCPYDAAFMAFWSLYKYSPTHWRNDWKQSVPEWNRPLGNNFDHLLILANTPIDVRNHTEWFSRYRDRFRDQLFSTDPSSFPRRGPVPAYISRILEVMFDRKAGPYLEQHLACGGCGVSSRADCDICFLATSHGTDGKTPVWLHAVWAEFVRRSKTDPARFAMTCSHCRGLNKVQALEMPDVPWIWFERNESSPVWPSQTLKFDSPSKQLSYTLQAVIYSGEKHFTLRFREPSGVWWKHDGQLASGVPQRDSIQSEADLLMNGLRFAYLLIYRRDGY